MESVPPIGSGSVGIMPISLIPKAVANLHSKVGNGNS